MADPIGWLDDIDEADDLMATRLENTAWFASGMTTARKTAALVTAQKRIVYSGLFTLGFDTPSSDALKDAQVEMAYYLVLHQAAEDRRQGLQAQGVTEAGIVQEKYNPAARGSVAIPPAVLGMLAAYTLAPGGFFAASVNRTEDDLIGDKQQDGADYR